MQRLVILLAWCVLASVGWAQAPEKRSITHIVVNYPPCPAGEGWEQITHVGLPGLGLMPLANVNRTTQQREFHTNAAFLWLTNDEFAGSLYPLTYAGEPDQIIIAPEAVIQRGLQAGWRPVDVITVKNGKKTRQPTIYVQHVPSGLKIHTPQQIR